MLTLKDCLDAGVVLLDEQLDFLHHPEGRLAVAVYGVPDPDRLYIAGPHDTGSTTLYQQAMEGEPADDRGMQAVVLPVVIEGEDQEDLARIVLDHEGDIKAEVPFVLGTLCNTECTYFWFDDTTPLYVAAWDIWPIDRFDMGTWVEAANNAVMVSALPAMFSFSDTYQNGTEHELTDDELEDEDFALLERLRELEKDYQGWSEQDEELAEIMAKREEIRAQQGSIGQRIMAGWEREMTHPVTGEIDAQMPPVDLPQEQAAIWRSLQSLSWRNWSMLEKHYSEGSVGPEDSRFVQANRRLCPWY